MLVDFNSSLEGRATSRRFTPALPRLVIGLLVAVAHELMISVLDGIRLSVLAEYGRVLLILLILILNPVYVDDDFRCQCILGSP